MNVLIVGATSGIGLSLAKRYLSKGHTVIGIGRRENDALSSAQGYEHIRLDVNDLHKTEHVLRDVLERGVELAYVCAGIGELNPSLDGSVELETISTNVVAWTNVVDILFNAFERNGRGHLVTITSVGGLRGEPVAPSYSASKAYQQNYTEALRKKAFKLKSDVRVTDIRPGLTDTAMAKGEGLFWVMPADKVAGQIITAVEKKKGIRVVTGRWRLLHFIMKRLPNALYDRM